MCSFSPWREISSRRPGKIRKPRNYDIIFYVPPGLRTRGSNRFAGANKMNVETKLQIPDLWYDFYARFLPGTAFVSLVYYRLFENPKTPDASILVIISFLGLFCGMVTQPISSRLVGWLHDLAALVRGEDRDYVERTKKILGAHESRILSKMHGESVFFVQCAVLSLLFPLTLLLFPANKYSGPFYCPLNAIVSILFLLGAIEVADRRIKRAKRKISVAT